ncbi:MAG: DUF3667 domain-containing protein [Aurantibacter sp.]
MTIKNLSYDISERYFNVDNTFLKTFIHLFRRPEVVIEGYIEGIRRKYLNPVSYLGIALTLSGFLVFLIGKYAAQIDFDVFNSGVDSKAMTPLFNFTMDFQALLFILYIPMMAVASWLAFENQKYNFTERLVVFMYALAHYSLFVFVPSVLLLLMAPEWYGKFSMLFLFMMYVYCAYVIKRISKLRGIDYWARVLLFFAIFTVFYFSLSLLLVIFLIITGEISIEDFAPNNS